MPFDGNAGYEVEIVEAAPVQKRLWWHWIGLGLGIAFAGGCFVEGYNLQHSRQTHPPIPDNYPWGIATSRIGEPTSPFPPHATYITTDEYYWDADGGLIRSDHTGQQIGPPEDEQSNVTGPASGNINGYSGLTETNGTGTIVGTSSSQIMYYNTGPGMSISGNNTWTSLPTGMVLIATPNGTMPISNFTVPINSLTVDGHTIPIRNGSANLTFDGHGGATVAFPYIESHPTITWHTVKRSFFDANGFMLSSDTQTHWYNGEYCHPGYMSNAGAPPSGRTSGT